MPDVWENTRSRWESVRHAVDGGGPGAAVGAATLHGRLGLSVNPIAVTGEAGAGKSVLYDALTQSIRTGDGDSSRSPDIEKHATVLRSGSRRTRAAVTVIPGQLSTQRERALHDTMRGTASPQGIVHVVCWGHNRIWQRGAQRDVHDALAADGVVDQEAVRGWHLRKEAADFRLLVDAIIDGQLATRLRWLVVVVSKTDLFWDRLDEARDHYIPGPPGRESPFAALLRDLENETSLRLSVLPMASRLIRHQFLPGLPAGTSQLDDTQIGALRTHLGQELQTLITQRNED
ncbi:hypothetical protein AMK14_20630 [Streptomyces sp. TSRI0445]|uniref:ATP-binding protein n=1 Tax=Streptomyces globisporus TaxID=1908 RepID=A0ABN8V3Z8_STRGL|nr:MULTISPECIES: hypothetical protein [Streptomyces]PPA38451.1 hypothetical protein BF14_001035 [Streptomyces griseus]RAN15894.1 hypothetical protein A3838_00990 [Streptomyces badius]AWL84669.1 hypothetical protein DIJ69_01030 [Streptomyces globisporus]OKI68524.1 hypothetical protein AMK14_20630 [Streptomyces sp. TSRI0445]RAN23743.1 hypothetical protein A3800_00970 [Streptomyces badius]